MPGGKRYPKTITGKDGAPMVHVPAGWFIMGSNDSSNDAKPRRRVYLDGFYIDKFSVTNSRFRASGMTPAEDIGSEQADGAMFIGSNQAIVGVPWRQAKAYCIKVGKRLPTEAEWEKAARGTDGRKYPWGNRWDPSKVIWRKNSGGKTHPVDRTYNTHESPYGAMDMVGNVREWVQDYYGYGYYQNAPNRNPKGPRLSSLGFPCLGYCSLLKALRGGSWNFNDESELRAAYRGWAGGGDVGLKQTANDEIGFRCAKDLN